MPRRSEASHLFVVLAARRRRRVGGAGVAATTRELALGVVSREGGVAARAVISKDF